MIAPLRRILVPMDFSDYSDRAFDVGIAATTIVEAASVERCDLIVMGTHGRTGLARLFMGSGPSE